jgi:transposase
LAQNHPEWALGFEDETWWSRFAMPEMHAWTEAGRQLHLVEQSVAKNDPDPKALACYGMLVRWSNPDGAMCEQPWLRFVEGRPISGVTTAFLEWSCAKLEALGKEALLLMWDNAPWHVSKEVRTWIRDHNRQVKRGGHGVRILSCYLPIKSPWLNPIEPKWIHGKRKVAESGRLLTAQELRDRVCAHFGCQHEEHLTIPKKVA